MQKNKHFTSSLFALYIYVSPKRGVRDHNLWLAIDNKAQNVFQTYITTTNENRLWNYSETHKSTREANVLNILLHLMV